MLIDTDYAALPDYDIAKVDVFVNRQAWREEIRNWRHYNLQPTLVCYG